MKENINNLRIEAESTLRYLYCVIAFHEALSDEGKVKKMNANPDYWRIYESSLLTSVFIGIRRLYESKNKTFNFQNFIEKRILEIEEFSLPKLKIRKIQTGAITEETAPTYLKNKYEPSINDFQEIARVVREKSKKMKGPYSNVASKVYTHAIHFSHSEALQSDQNLNLYEMEETLLSVWHCYEQVWQLYDNGNKPTFNDQSYPYKNEVINSVHKQINA